MRERNGRAGDRHSCEYRFILILTFFPRAGEKQRAIGASTEGGTVGFRKGLESWAGVPRDEAPEAFSEVSILHADSLLDATDRRFYGYST